MFMVLRRAAVCGRVRESTSRSSPFLAATEKMTSTDPVGF